MERNVRGLQRLHKQAALKTFCLSNCVDVICILESKFSNLTFSSFFSTWMDDWSLLHNFETTRNGWILVMWNNAKVQLTPISIEEQVIHSEITCKAYTNSFVFSLCYGRNKLAERRELWDSLISKIPLDRPALLCGDFNCVMSSDERVGGRVPNEKEYCDFPDTYGFLGLQDAISTGCR